jgi:hypothetical protein
LKPTLWPLRPASQNPFADAPSVGRRVPAQGQPAAGCYLNQFQQFIIESDSSFHCAKLAQGDKRIDSGQ